MKYICIYCGSKPGRDAAFAETTRELGTLMARQGIGLVYGGGNVGLMGIAADAVLAGGGQVIGVIPEDLVQRELAHQGLSKMHIVGSMHERKQLMCDLAAGFIALPGGFGTLDEIMEMITWRQLGYHRKHCGLLNITGYYDHLLRFLDHAVDSGLIRPAHRDLIVDEEQPEQILARVLSEPVPAPK